jgi:hypothetical protein
MSRIVLLAGAAAFMAFCASAFAQAAKAPRTAASLQCSQQADAKGLHGTARKHFRSRCMRDMAKAGKAKGEPMRGYR